MLLDRISTLTVPTDSDFDGATAALLRLQRTYSLPTSALAKGQVFDEPAANQLGADDYYKLGEMAFNVRELILISVSRSTFLAY